MFFFGPPSSHPYHSFPLDSITIKHALSGQYVTAQVVHLTRFAAWYWVDRPWSKFSGPYVDGYDARPDAHWKWNSFVRRHRKNQDLVRCGSLLTPDERTQGAIIYRFDGASILEPDERAVYIEYLAASPYNRKDCARDPLYAGVGSGLLTLAILHSYDLGFGGRVVLHSLPTAVKFYKKHDFVKTGASLGRMIHCELSSESATRHLEGLGLI